MFKKCLGQKMLPYLAWDEWYKHISSQISEKIIENRLRDLHSLQYISNCSWLVICFKQSGVLSRWSTLIDFSSLWNHKQSLQISSETLKKFMLTMSGEFSPVTACNLRCHGYHPSLPKLGKHSASATPKERSRRAQEADICFQVDVW